MVKTAQGFHRFPRLRLDRSGTVSGRPRPPAVFKSAHTASLHMYMLGEPHHGNKAPWAIAAIDCEEITCCIVVVGRYSEHRGQTRSALIIQS